MCLVIRFTAPQMPSAGAIMPYGPPCVSMQVPLRRVNQSYVIATSTIVDVSSADLGSLTDDKFVPPKKPKKKGGEAFFEQPEGKKVFINTCCI